MQRIVLAGALVVAVATLVFASRPDSARARRHAGPSTGLRTVAFAQPPPDFSFDAGDGPVRLGSLVGKPVVINFWATWCKPCTDELGAFDDLERTYGDAVSLVSISAEQPGVARAFLQARALAWPVVEDPARKIFDAYSVGPIPVTIVLDRTGRVGHVSVGELDWAELRDAVASAGSLGAATGSLGRAAGSAPLSPAPPSLPPASEAGRSAPSAPHPPTSIRPGRFAY